MDGRPARLKQMFNILTDLMPDRVTVDGEECYMKTHFKRWIEFELIMTNPKLKDEIKLAAILPLCFKKLPSDADKAVKACMKFYCGNVKRGKAGAKTSYSFLYDAELIYAAFMTQYGIDLSVENIHWYKFRALFKGLKSDNKISEVMQLREMNLSEIKDADIRRKYQQLKKLWELPDLRTDSEKESEIVCAVEGLD